MRHVSSSLYRHYGHREKSPYGYILAQLPNCFYTVICIFLNDFALLQENVTGNLPKNQFPLHIT